MKLLAWFLLTFIGVAIAAALDDQGPNKDDLKEMRGFPYGEILVSNSAKGWSHAFDLVAYNTLMFGVDLDKWNAITEKDVQKQFNSIMVKLNGPRFWVMDTVDFGKSTLVDSSITYIGGLKMVVVGVPRASLWDIFCKLVFGDVNTYAERAVVRKTTYVFKAGRLIYTLTSPEGKQYVMQSGSAQYNPLNIDSLQDLGSKLKLPAGWKYRVIRLEKDLYVTAKDAIGRIVNDEFFNTYSLFDSELLEGNIREGIAYFHILLIIFPNYCW